MRRIVLSAFAGSVMAATLAGAPGPARADDDGLAGGGRDFCYSFWRRDVDVDYDQGLIFVEEECPDDGSRFLSVYALPPGYPPPTKTQP